MPARLTCCASRSSATPKPNLRRRTGRLGSRARARGQRDAPEMARRLRGRGSKPEQDPVRAPRCARSRPRPSWCARWEFPRRKCTQDERLYLASPKDMLRSVRELGGTRAPPDGGRPQPGDHGVRRSHLERALDRQPADVRRVHAGVRDRSWSELEWSSGVNAELDYPKRSA